MPRRNLIWIAIILAMATVLLFVWRQPRRGTTVHQTEFVPVRETYQLIRQAYYQPVDEIKLRQAAVRGMVGELDEFSTYFLPEQAKAITHRVKGLDRGLGLRLDLDAKGARIIGVVPGSPAHSADLLPGDRILTVDAIPTAGKTDRQLRDLLAGKLGATVELQILSPAGWKQTVMLTHGEFPIETVRGLYRDQKGRWIWEVPSQEGIYYVRIVEFCPKTSRALLDVLHQLSPLRGLVLDLRANPGGLQEIAVALADVFLSRGTIVTVLTRNDPPKTHQAHDDTPFSKVPMVVLIDETTTSAAEIVAGALGANARAVLIGRRTRGKGCVQSMVRLPGELGQINLTTAEFLIPPDRPIQRRPGGDRWGVAPQINVTLSPKQTKTLRRLRIEAETWPAPALRTTTASDKGSEQIDPRDLLGQKLLQLDTQLDRAVTLLGKPKEMQAILQRMRTEISKAAEERKKRAAIQQTNNSK